MNSTLEHYVHITVFTTEEGVDWIISHHSINGSHLHDFSSQNNRIHIPKTVVVVKSGEREKRPCDVVVIPVFEALVF